MSAQYIILDFEMNPVDRKNRGSAAACREIIEIGAIRLDENFELKDEFRSYVKPHFSSLVDDRILRMTGITTSNIVDAVSLEEILSTFESWIGYEADTTVYSWSASDRNQLTTECDVKGIAFPANMNVCKDAQKIYSKAMGCFDRGRALSLRKAAEQFGIIMDQKKSHSALYDAKVTAQLVSYIKNGEYKTQIPALKKASVSKNEQVFSIGEACGSLLSLFLQASLQNENSCAV